MNSNAILTSDVLDILFDKRNKKYGAYTLRKFYPERVKTSLLIMLGFAAAVSSFTFLPEGKAMGGTGIIEDGMTVKQVIEIPKDIEKPKEASMPKQKPVPVQQLTAAYETVPDTKPSTVFHDISGMAIGTATDTTGMPIGPANIFPTAPTGEPAAPPEPEPDLKTPVDNPDIQASFPGGSKALLYFLQRNLVAPEEISEAVQVKVKFVVGFDGNLQAFEVVQDGGIDFNNEVIRVLKKMPQWVPGKKGGRNVPVFYVLPVKFAPND